MFFKFLEWWRNYRLERLKLKLEAKTKPFETIKEVVEKLTTAQASQTRVLEMWMASFNTHEIPKSVVVRDEDEFTEEQNREWESLHGGIPKEIAESVRNGIKAGAFPDIKDMFDIP